MSSTIAAGDLPEVKGLRAYHDAFSRNDELILVIEGGEETFSLIWSRPNTRRNGD